MEYQFANLYGQTGAVAHLQNVLRSGEVSQAYILCGERGSGRYRLAMSFAKALQCHHRQEENGLLEPCGVCHSCRQAESGNHPDIITVLPQKESRNGTLLIGDARFVKDDVLIRPYSSDWKIYILPDADRMNAQAQNALLKTLEEPPSYAVLLLLAESTAGFLPTVLSRCITLRMQPVPSGEIAAHLETEGVEKERALLCARLSHGNVGRAASYASDEDVWNFRETVLQLLENLSQTDTLRLTQFASELTPAQAELFLDLAESWVRDLAVIRSTGETKQLIFQDAEAWLTEAAGCLRLQEIQAGLSACELARRRRNANGSDAQVLEMLLLSLRSAFRRAPHSKSV